MAGLLGSAQGRGRAGESKRRPGGRFSPYPQLHLSSFLSFLLTILLFVLPTLLNLEVLVGLFRWGCGGARRWVSGTVDTRASHAHHRSAGLWEGLVVVPTEVILAREGKRGPGLGREGAVSRQTAAHLCVWEGAGSAQGPSG